MYAEKTIGFVRTVRETKLESLKCLSYFPDSGFGFELQPTRVCRFPRIFDWFAVRILFSNSRESREPPSNNRAGEDTKKKNKIVTPDDPVPFRPLSNDPFARSAISTCDIALARHRVASPICGTGSPVLHPGKPSTVYCYSPFQPYSHRYCTLVTANPRRPDVRLHSHDPTETGYCFHTRNYPTRRPFALLHPSLTTVTIAFIICLHYNRYHCSQIIIITITIFIMMIMITMMMVQCQCIDYIIFKLSICMSIVNCN